MDKRMDLNCVLDKAKHSMDFNDGSMDRIWRNAENAKRKRTPKLAWMVPAAAALTVLLSVAVIPQARAAMLGIFERMIGVMDYMNMDQSARPENTELQNLLIGNMPVDMTVAVAPGSVDNGWVKDVKVHVDEVLYDGQNIYVKYTVDGRGIAGFRNDSSLTDSIGKYVTVRAKSFTLSDAHGVIPNDSWIITAKPEKSDDKAISTTTVKLSQTDMKLSGDIKVELVLSCDNEIGAVDSQGLVGQNPAGKLTLSFEFNAGAGNASTKSLAVAGEKHDLYGSVVVSEENEDADPACVTVVNRKASLEGCSMTVVSAVRSPAETTITVCFEPSAEFYSIFAYTELGFDLLDGDMVVGRDTDGYSGPSDKPYVFNFVLTAPFLPDSVKKLTVRTHYEYYGSIGGKSLETGAMVKIPKQSGGGYGISDAKAVTAELPGGTFDITLP